MIRFAAIVSLGLAGAVAPALPAKAASFDCTRAQTPFEHAICESPELSAADVRLSRTYATAAGGLSEAATSQLRGDQRNWLAYAQRACTSDATPMTSGTYDESAVRCLINIFQARSGVLEGSRMLEGLRFYPVSDYVAIEDPEAEADSSWQVAEHELSLIQLDEELDYAQAFNTLVRAEGDAMQGGDETVTSDAGSDSSNTISAKSVSGNLITLDVTSYWYGHGAAHGNYTVTYLHFLKDEQRWMEARDLFAGKRWQQALLDLTVEALRAEHGDMLMLDSTEYIEDSVIDPRRWDLSSPYGLRIQFQPYEVSAYAYGAPTATIRWEALQPFYSDTGSRYGH